MSNQCHKCKSRNTATVKAKDMADKTGNSSFITTAYGAVDPILVIGALTSIIKALRELFGWLNRKEKNNGCIVVCKDCGYWKRV